MGCLGDMRASVNLGVLLHRFGVSLSAESLCFCRLGLDISKLLQSDDGVLHFLPLGGFLVRSAGVFHQSLLEPFFGDDSAAVDSFGDSFLAIAGFNGERDD